MNMNEQSRVIGVGPHPQPWPDGKRFDKELLATGDTRNVADKYRYWSIDAIKADMAQHAIPLHIAIENWQHDSNIGTIVRTANALNVACVHVIGKRHWNRRGAMVTDRYLSIEHHPTVADFVAAIGERSIIAIDNVAGSHALSTYTFPVNAVLVFGGEGPGLSDELLNVSDASVQIEQDGSTRSINVGVAAGIVMYQWAYQHKVLLK